MTKLIERNGQNQALKSSSVEVKFLTLALCFFLTFLCFFVYIYVCVYVFIICLFSLALFCVCVISILGC